MLARCRARLIDANTLQVITITLHGQGFENRRRDRYDANSEKQKPLLGRTSRIMCICYGSNSGHQRSGSEHTKGHERIR